MSKPTKKRSAAVAAINELDVSSAVRKVLIAIWDEVWGAHGDVVDALKAMKKENAKLKRQLKGKP